MVGEFIEPRSDSFKSSIRPIKSSPQIDFCFFWSQKKIHDLRDVRLRMGVKEDKNRIDLFRINEINFRNSTTIQNKETRIIISLNLNYTCKVRKTLQDLVNCKL